jgi:hypothetical protein
MTGLERTVLILILVGAAVPAAAQLPGTDIYLAPLYERSGRVVIGAPGNVTMRPGYDNQPSFLNGDAFLFSAEVDTSGATDVFRYQVPSATTQRMTDTPESEYSPTLMPDGKHFSAVRIELDGTQRLWRFDRDGTSPRVIAADVDSVGYHAWYDDHTVVLFIVGTPHSLRVVDTDAGTETLVARDVGRSILPIPGSDEISFLQRVEGAWWVMRLDPETGAVTPLAEALEGSQDCAWTPGGHLLMGRGGRVYALEGDGSKWAGLVTFGEPALQGLTRLAVDPTGRWLALVGADAN